MNLDHEVAFTQAKAIQKKLNKRDKELSNKMVDELNLLDIPNWKAGLGKNEITEEMRNERNRIRDENEKRVNHHQDQQQIVYKKVETYKKRLLNNYKTKTGIDVKMVETYLDNYEKDEYGYEPVEFVK